MKLNIPHVQVTDVERWTKVLGTVGPLVSASIEAGILQNGRQIMLHFRNGLNAAIVAHAVGDANRFRVELQGALRRFQMFFLPEFSSKVDPSYIYESSEEALCIALILRERNAEALANQIIPYARGRSDSRADFLRALGALLAGKREIASSIADLMIQSPTLSHGSNLPLAIKSIAERDPGAFLASVGKALLEFDRHAAGEARGTPEAAIFIRGAALVNLYGMINSEGLPQHDFDVRLMPPTE